MYSDELSLSDSQYQKLIRDRKAGVHSKFVHPIGGGEELLKLQFENKQLREKLAIAEEIIEFATIISFEPATPINTD